MKKNSLSCWENNLEKIKRFWHKYDIWIILAGAFLIRVGKLSHAYYGTTSELFRDLIVSYDFLVNKQIPLLGPSASLGAFNFGAVYYYLLAPFVWLFRFNPIGAVFTSTVFSVLSVYMLYRLVELWFRNRRIALLAAGLAAVSLFDVQNAYYISNPNLMPFFLLLFFYCLTKFLEDKASWLSAIGLGLSLGFATQLHATALFVLPLVVMVAYIWRRPKLNWQQIFLALFTLILTYAPYIFYELTHHFENIRRILSLGQHNFGLPKLDSLAAIIRFWDSLFFFKNDFFNLFVLNHIIFFILLPFYLVIPFLVWFWLRDRETLLVDSALISRSGKAVLLSWLAVGSLTFIFYSNKIPPFYFLVLWPLPVILLAWLLMLLRANHSYLFKYILAVYLVTQFIQLGFFARVLDQHPYNHYEIKSLLSEIPGNAAGKTFSVINATDHINLFMYYYKLLGLDREADRNRPDYVYLVYNTGETDVFQPSTQHYQFIEQFGNSTFTVAKYLLRK